MSGGAVLPLWGAGDRGWHPTVSAQKGRLVYSRVVDDWNIWRYALGDAGPGAKRIVSSSQNENQPQISPNGKRIVFVSNRSGSLQLWRCDADGSNELRLTTTHRPGSPRWSPDGEFIVFDDAASGKWDIFVVRSEGGLPRQLTAEDGTDARPVWSPDGRWIYFNSDRSGENQIWRVAAEGGKAEQVTRQGGCCPLVSPDGALVYYGKDYLKDGIWKVPAAGGEEVAVFKSLKAPGWGLWDVTSNGIYFIPAPEEAEPTEYQKWTLQFFSFVTQKVTPVTDLAKPPARSGAFDISPDGTWFVYAQWDLSGSDLMLVENFR